MIYAKDLERKEQRKKLSRVIQCDRCGKTYEKNERYQAMGLYPIKTILQNSIIKLTNWQEESSAHSESAHLHRCKHLRQRRSQSRLMDISHLAEYSRRKKMSSAQYPTRYTPEISAGVTGRVTASWLDLLDKTEESKHSVWFLSVKRM